MADITLLCLVLGENADENSFPVHIRNNNRIGDLKNTIKAQRLDLFEDPNENSFDICIDRSKTINQFKEAIKKMNPVLCEHTDARSIDIWKVDIPLDTPNDKLTTLQDDLADIDVDNDLNGTKLQQSWRPISYYFTNQPAAAHIHVVIQPPTGT